MKHYIFQFGRFPKLSQAELTQRVPDFERISIICPGFYQISGEEIQNPQTFLDGLGGSIRIIEEIGESEGRMGDNIAEYLHNLFPEGKIQFGLSVFPEKNLKLKDIALDAKNALKKKNRSVRCINRNFQNLDAGTLHRENIFRKKNGIEIIVLKNQEGKLIAGKTVAAQDVEAFSERDYKKPERDMTLGMLPPKVALMMVNMASINGSFPKIIWDPFCGTGTINVEAKRLGISSIGSDISPKIIDAAQKNFIHFFGNSGNFFVHDAARQIPEADPRFQILWNIDTIVSEGYLGPIFGHPLSEKDYQNATNKAEPIMRKFFHETGKMKHLRRIVISLPFWKMQNGKDGFCEDALQEAKKYWKSSLQNSLVSSRGSLLYRRENQTVGREVFVLEKTTVLPKSVRSDTLPSA